MSASTPRILQSADEAPCGSLWARTLDGRLVLRLLTGRGCNIPPVDASHQDSWPWDENNLDHDFPARLIAEGLTEAECRHLSGLSAADAVAWCERRDADVAEQTAAFSKGGPCARKPCPQPGDVVPWAEATEPGCLYFDERSFGGCPFLMSIDDRTMWLSGAEDHDVELTLKHERGDNHPARSSAPHALLVARNLGTDPKAWRRAMREWTANGNKPTTPVTSLAAAVADIDATAEVGESAAWAKVKAATVDINAYMHNVHRALMVAEDDRDTARKERDEARMALRDERTSPILQAQIKFLEGSLDTLRGHLRGAGAGLARAQKERDAANGQRDIEVAHTEAARKERDEARIGWAEQSADAARLRLELEKAQQQIVQGHEDIDALIAKQTAADFEITALKTALASAKEWSTAYRSMYHEQQQETVKAAALALKHGSDATHRGRILGQLLDEMVRGYFVDRFLDPNLYADAMKAAGRVVKP